MNKMIGEVIAILTIDEHSLLLTKKKFIRINRHKNNQSDYVILDISKDNLGNNFNEIKYDNLEGYLVWFRYGHIHAFFDYIQYDKIKCLLN
jgi:hypothetical protein